MPRTAGAIQAGLIYHMLNVSCFSRDWRQPPSLNTQSASICVICGQPERSADYADYADSKSRDRIRLQYVQFLRVLRALRGEKRMES